MAPVSNGAWKTKPPGTALATQGLTNLRLNPSIRFVRRGFFGIDRQTDTIGRRNDA